MPHRPDLPGHVRIDTATAVGDGWVLFVEQSAGSFAKVDLTAAQAASCEVLTEDGAGDSAALLAGLWTAWMRAAGSGARSAVLASTPLRPYAHQMNAVYGAMLPQPRLRFLLADEPGTGKTIMAGLYLREMQRLGFVSRALIVVPAHLVTKWQADFERFFGGGLRAITAQTVREHGLESDHDLWIVSLDLLSVNGLVQDAVHPDRMGWDAVVFDEAHRLTPTAVGYYQAGEMLALNTPRALLMTATPHRGKEWLFRALLHLVDPEVYPPVESNNEPSRTVKPGRVHFLRRMKEDLVDFDGVTKLFKGRHAENHSVALSPVEAEFYYEALDLVDRYFPSVAVPLGKMVYGKRAASSLYALAETLKRRRDGMGTVMPSAAAYDADPDGEDAPKADEARVIHEGSKSAKAERKEIDGLLKRLLPLVSDLDLPVSKWDPLALTCLGRNGVKPGNGEQGVVFTEYADTADWLVQKLLHAGYTSRRYSGRDNHHVRDDTRDAFARRDFQILVSTDAGNEGIDLQTAHVLVNYDIPWSLVRLEQRMGSSLDRVDLG
jgi:SNF2 family DNA or RNA helicase